MKEENKTERHRNVERMRAENMSYGRIAKVMGITRCVIAGLVNRTGAKPRKHTRHKKLPQVNQHTKASS